MAQFIEHELIRPNTIEYREYQTEISKKCLEKSTMVVLPTGMGKTVIAMLVIADIYKKYPDKKILFLAPTKPLVEQHARYIKEHSLIEPVIVLTGEVSPKKRAKLWNDAKIFATTPQVIKNDIEADRITLKDVSLIIYDEAHRGVGRYSYVKINEYYKQQNPEPHTLGITASPGSERERIESVCKALGLDYFEARTEKDSDVAPYIQKAELKFVDVELPIPIAEAVEKLKQLKLRKLQSLVESGLLITRKPLHYISMKDILECNNRIRAALLQNKGSAYFNAASICAQLMKLNSILEIAETQGYESLVHKFEEIEEKAVSKEASKADKILIKEPEIVEAMNIIRRKDIYNPKLELTLKIILTEIENKKDAKFIVFTQYRDTADTITATLAQHEPKIRPIRFVGQATKGEDKGLTQKEQVEILSKFRNNIYNVLVATSVAEEGLDIPSTDTVIFYEPVPSEIRNIQRRGRVARTRPGKIIVLKVKGTRDQAYLYSSIKKEKKMRAYLRDLKTEKTIEKKTVKKTGQTTLFDY